MQFNLNVLKILKTIEEEEEENFKSCSYLFVLMLFLFNCYKSFVIFISSSRS